MRLHIRRYAGADTPTKIGVTVQYTDIGKLIGDIEKTIPKETVLKTEKKKKKKAVKIESDDDSDDDVTPVKKQKKL